VKTVKKAWDAIACEWNEYRTKPSGPAKLLLRGCRGKKALDAGCGNGRNATLIAKKFASVEACDFSPQMAANAKKNLRGNKKVRVVVADIRKMPYADSTFDAVFCLAALHHFRKPQLRHALAELNRVLKRGGSLHASVWNKEQPKFQNVGKNARVPWRLKAGGLVQRFHSFHSALEWKEMLRENGFKSARAFYESNGKRAPAQSARNLCFAAEKA